MSTNRSLFFSFLESVSLIQQHNHHKLPDLDAQVLMMYVCIANEKKKPLNVTQAMNMKSIGSPAMLYRKINDLLSLELVELVYEGSNRRTKYLIPTSKALVFADEMADAAVSIYQPISLKPADARVAVNSGQSRCPG
jgi:hypothetical protein